MPASQRQEKQPLQVLPSPISLNFLLHIFISLGQELSATPLGPTPLSSKPYHPSCWGHLTSWHSLQGYSQEKLGYPGDADDSLSRRDINEKNVVFSICWSPCYTCKTAQAHSPSEMPPCPMGSSQSHHPQAAVPHCSPSEYHYLPWARPTAKLDP